MKLKLQGVLTPAELDRAKQLLEHADWEDGRQSAGSQARLVKDNLQLPHHSEAATELRAMILAGLSQHPLFYSVTLAHKIFTPRINRYDPAHPHYGKHVDNAIRARAGLAEDYVRADISCTVFLNDPDEYDGGELVFEDGLERHSIKLTAGDAIVYPGNTVHEVRPVTRGHRHASFLWIQSLVRSSDQRSMLFSLDANIMKLRDQLGDTPETVELVGLYHNLLREWAQT